MNRLFVIGDPVSDPEPLASTRLGRQGTTILQLAELGIEYLPGLLVGIDDLRSSFKATLTAIKKQGLPVIERATGLNSKAKNHPLPLEVLLLPDVSLDPDSGRETMAVSRDSLGQTIKDLVDAYDADELNHTLPAAVMVRYRPETVTSGNYRSRDLATGLKLSASASRSALNLPVTELSRLEKGAKIAEQWFLDIRRIDYIHDGNRVWIADQREAGGSVQARLKLLAELFQQKQISKKAFLSAITPEELGSIFYNRVDPVSAETLARIEGGTTGSAGACCGRVYFSAHNLVAAHRQAAAAGEAADFILLKESTTAEDLEAIRLCCGVVSSKGGYTSHAPIVARYLGKPALIHPEIQHHGSSVTVLGQAINEGQTISLDLASGEGPVMYLGATRIQPVHQDSEDLKSLLHLASECCGTTRIRANADTEKEAILAREYMADGIGLCRTEHMLMDSDALQILQKLIADEEDHKRAQLLSDLKSLLTEAFLKLFRIMDGLPMTIRLLDAPLHEFLPDSTRTGKRHQQLNPMLGLRGCRLGLFQPDLYEMQVQAVLNAALKAQAKEGVTVKPDLLIPFVSSHREMAILKKGDETVGRSINGINGIVREILEAEGLAELPFEFKVGAVIEIPSAAISAAKIALQTPIISFGTNDLTQTTLGISRDDIGSLRQMYEELNIWEGDPFQNLVDPVKQLITSAVESARAVRPDLEAGICGEAGGSYDTIRFAVHLGLNYISCAAREVPRVLLAAARLQLDGRS